MEKPLRIATFSELKDRQPVHAEVNGLDLVVTRFDDRVSVLYGRCLHRGALMADGHVSGEDIICGLHGWDYRLDSGVSAYNNSEALHKFTATIEDDGVWVDEKEISDYLEEHPQPFARDQYLGLYADTHPEDTEPYTRHIRELSRNGLKRIGHHGFTAAMGVDRNSLPKWEDIQLLPAQLWKKPLLDEAPVVTETIIGPGAERPLRLALPLFVSDMSFGALSREAKIALARGAEMAETGICSGEGGMLPDEQASNSRYFYELASARFGFGWDKVAMAQAFHFKGGQGAKTGTSAISPFTFSPGRCPPV
ncbi:MAG: glutamate synthase-related protein, partial [Sedimenticola sp.]